MASFLHYFAGIKEGFSLWHPVCSRRVGNTEAGRHPGDKHLQSFSNDGKRVAPAREGKMGECNATVRQNSILAALQRGYT
jgi:hypothetical protein